MAGGNPFYVPGPPAILGSNDNDNSFLSDDVVANRDGSIIERQEWIINALGGAQARFEQSISATVEEDVYLQFTITLFDLDAGAVASASIDITSISNVMSKGTAAGAAFSAAGITQPTFAKSNGLVTCSYRFLAAEWAVGDVYRLVVGGITAVVDGETVYVPDMVWSNLIVEAADMTAEMAKIPKSDSTITWNDVALQSIQDECEDALEGENLDHLAKVAVDTNLATTVHDDSILGNLFAKANVTNFNRTTDSMEMLSDKLGAYSGDGGADYNDSVKAAIELLSKFIASGDGDMAGGTQLASNKSIPDALGVTGSAAISEEFSMQSLFQFLYGKHDTVHILFILPEAVGSINADNTVLQTELGKLGEVMTITQADLLAHAELSSYTLVVLGTNSGTAWTTANLADLKLTPDLPILCVDKVASAYLEMGTDGGDAATKTDINAVSTIEGSIFGIGACGLTGLAAGANVVSTSATYHTLDMSDVDITETWWAYETANANTDVVLGGIFKQQNDGELGIDEEGDPVPGSLIFAGFCYDASELTTLGKSTFKLAALILIHERTVSSSIAIIGAIRDFEKEVIGNQKSLLSNPLPLADFITGSNSGLGEPLPTDISLYDAVRTLEGLCFAGIITTATSATEFKVAKLANKGTNVFNDKFYIQIVEADSAAPEGEVKKVSAYTTGDGTFTTAAFSVAPDVGDQIILYPESIFAIGQIADAALAMNTASNGAQTIVTLLRSILERLGETPADSDDSAHTILGQRDLTVPAMNAAMSTSNSIIEIVSAIKERLGATPADTDDPLHLIHGQRDDAAPGMNVAPANSDSIIMHLKAIRETVGQEPADADDSLHTTVGQRDATATSDDLSDIASTGLNAKVRRALLRFSAGAFSTTIDPGGSARTCLEDLWTDLGAMIAGADGITTWPAAADIGDGKSLAEGIRAILTSLVGGDNFDGYTNINNTANVSINAALQNIATIFGANAANVFNPTITGSARTDLDTALAELAKYFATNGAAISSTVDPGGSARATLELILEDIAKMLAGGGGISTFPSAVAPGDGVSMAEVIRANYDALTGGLTAAERSKGKLQIAATTIDLDQAAGTDTLFTGTTQSVLLTGLTIRIPNVDISGGALTSISIQTDDVTPAVLISAAAGALGNLTEEATLTWSDPAGILIPTGTLIQLTIAGGAAGVTCTCNIVAQCRAVVNLGYLA